APPGGPAEYIRRPTPVTCGRGTTQTDGCRGPDASSGAVWVIAVDVSLAMAEKGRPRRQRHAPHKAHRAARTAGGNRPRPVHPWGCVPLPAVDTARAASTAEPRNPA